jgi:hypothetical protein
MVFANKGFCTVCGLAGLHPATRLATFNEAVKVQIHLGAPGFGGQRGYKIGDGLEWDFGSE